MVGFSYDHRTPHRASYGRVSPERLSSLNYCGGAPCTTPSLGAKSRGHSSLAGEPKIELLRCGFTPISAATPTDRSKQPHRSSRISKRRLVSDHSREQSIATLASTKAWRVNAAAMDQSPWLQRFQRCSTLPKIPALIATGAARVLSMVTDVSCVEAVVVNRRSTGRAPIAFRPVSTFSLSGSIFNTMPATRVGPNRSS